MQLPAAVTFTEENSICAGSDQTCPTGLIHVGHKSIRVGQEYTDTSELPSQILKTIPYFFSHECVCLNQFYTYIILQQWVSRVNYALQKKNNCFVLNLPVARSIWYHLVLMEEDKKPSSPCFHLVTSLQAEYYSVLWGLHRKDFHIFIFAHSCHTSQNSFWSLLYSSKSLGNLRCFIITQIFPEC